MTLNSHTLFVIFDTKYNDIYLSGCLKVQISLTAGPIRLCFSENVYAGPVVVLIFVQGGLVKGSLNGKLNRFSG